MRAILVGALLVLAACGGDPSSPDTPRQEPPTPGLWVGQVGEVGSIYTLVLPQSDEPPFIVNGPDSPIHYVVLREEDEYSYHAGKGFSPSMRMPSYSGVLEEFSAQPIPGNMFLDITFNEFTASGTLDSGAGEYPVSLVPVDAFPPNLNGTEWESRYEYEIGWWADGSPMLHEETHTLRFNNGVIEGSRVERRLWNGEIVESEPISGEYSASSFDERVLAITLTIGDSDSMDGYAYRYSDGLSSKELTVSTASGGTFLRMAPN